MEKETAPLTFILSCETLKKELKLVGYVSMHHVS
jgi:hypothetical protein